MTHGVLLGSGREIVAAGLCFERLHQRGEAVGGSGVGGGQRQQRQVRAGVVGADGQDQRGGDRLHVIPRKADALGLAGRSRRIQDIGGVIAVDRHALRRLHPELEGVPGEIAPLDQLGDFLFARAFELMAPYLKPTTPVGVVKSANRKKQEKWISSFAEFDFEPVDMTSLVIVGNQSTYVQDGLMITPRGYAVPHGDDESACGREE